MSICTIISDGAVDFSRDESADPDEIVCVHIASDDDDDNDVEEDEAADGRASVAGEDDAQPLDWSLIIEEAINNNINSNNKNNNNNNDMVKATSTSKHFTKRKKSFSAKEMLNDFPLVIDRVGLTDQTFVSINVFCIILYKAQNSPYFPFSLHPHHSKW